jgi:hypothetical protein
MSQPSPPGTGARVRAAMRAGDFRRLLWIRLSGQGGDGIFQAALIASVVFNPDQQNTAEGLLYASLVTILPFTLLGPFVGVFIDRWSRRKILTIAPLLKIAFVPLILFDPLHYDWDPVRRGARGAVDQPMPAGGGLGRRAPVPQRICRSELDRNRRRTLGCCFRVAADTIARA